MNEGAVAAGAQNVAECPLRGVELPGLEIRNSLREAVGERRGEILRGHSDRCEQDEEACRVRAEQSIHGT
jgi:hypothetical protein